MLADNVNTENKESNYSILGISENADKERVEKKYAMLIKQYKHKTDEYGTTNEDLAYYNKITRAYNEIMGIDDDYSDTDPMNIIPYSVRKRFQKFSATIENYKMLICGVLLLGVIILLTIMQIKDSFKDDISIKFVGDFASEYSQTEDGYVDAQIKNKSEVVDAPTVSFFTVIEGETTLLDSTAKNASVQFRTEFTTGALDVIIIDKENLDIYIKQLVFLKLDDFLEEHKNDAGFSNLNVYEYTNSGEEGDYTEDGIYAIEISDMSFFDGMNIEKKYPDERQTMYLALARTSKRPDIAKAFAAEIISTNK